MKNQISMHLQLFYWMNQSHQLSVIVDAQFQSLDNKQHVYLVQQAMAVYLFSSARLLPKITI